MLKALELCGFKSFADRTRFEFPAGITVVVGPNGSGKSNIVDAMKWVLGEQSAKSLRGKEMADVIFKGSGGGGGRKPANSAEATLVFDNENGLLDTDSPEVRITRRVYRSGEAEYLLNGSACRLRDIRDLFRGTGVGTDAYSLIEQGKVDTLLQTSPRERRAIFEEAAGISRFKAKKVETQRRLERVETNLTRLGDIVEEVESRLKAVRNQATKARRYKEYTDRLQQLRTHVGSVDWRRLSERMAVIGGELNRLRAEHEEKQACVADAEQELNSFDQATQSLNEEVRAAESAIGRIREQIAAFESTAESERKVLVDYEAESKRARRQLANMSHRVGDTGQQLEAVQAELADAESAWAAAKATVQESEVRQQELHAQLHSLQQQRDASLAEHQKQTQLAQAVTIQLRELESNRAAAQSIIQRSETERANVLPLQQELGAKRDAARASVEELTANAQQVKTQLAQAKTELNAAQTQLEADQKQQFELQRQHTVANERANVLQELEQQHDGLMAGVKDVLLRAHHGESTFQEVEGLVADVLRVDIEMAAAIDAVLGDVAQYIVTKGCQLTDAIRQGVYSPPGRVGLVSLAWLDQLSSPGNAFEPIDLTSEPGVLGRADSFVDVDAGFDSLRRHLLVDTWCVESLSDAVRLAESYPGRFRFVTKQREVVQPDGTWLVGARRADAGLVTRKSQLRSLRQEIMEVTQRIRQTEDSIEQAQQSLAKQTDAIRQLSNEHDMLVRDLTQQRLELRSHEERVKEMDDRLRILDDQIASASSEVEQSNLGVTQHQLKQQQVATLLSQLLEATQSQADQLRQMEQQHQQRLTSWRICESVWLSLSSEWTTCGRRKFVYPRRRT
ncbi:MAG: chromosome segregation protein SMC [Pirellulaceae bacterium]